MKTFVGINNVERFADQLSSAADPGKRATLMRLLVEEEDKLGVGLQQLGACELWIAKGRRLIARQQALIARVEAGGRDPHEEKALLHSLMELQALFEGYRRRVMSGLNNHVV